MEDKAGEVAYGWLWKTIWLSERTLPYRQQCGAIKGEIPLKSSFTLLGNVHGESHLAAVG